MFKKTLWVKKIAKTYLDIQFLVISGFVFLNFATDIYIFTLNKLITQINNPAVVTNQNENSEPVT